MVVAEFPRTQALRPGTFTPPVHLLEDPETTVIDIYQWNESHNAEHPLFRFVDGDDIRTISWEQAVKAIRKAACYFASHVTEPTSLDSGNPPPIIAILANSDTITYFCTIVGIFWAGFTAFPISPRNGTEAVAELLGRTGTAYLCVSPEPRLLNLADAASRIVRSNDRQASVLNMPNFESLFSLESTLDMTPFLKPKKRDLDAPMIILHSSGSTAHPKPISWSARRLKQWTLVPWYGDIDFAGLVMGCHAMPMFHGMGVLQISSAASSGLVIATFKPTSPATFPTPANVFAEAVATKSELICCVPSFVEEWITDDSKVEHMKTMKGMIFGGGPLSKTTGDRLAKEGVALYQQYGCTEVGVMNTFLPVNPGMDWEFLSMSKQFRSEFVPYGDETYELVVVAGDNHKPAVTNTKIENSDAYATKDLFIPHPTKPNLWKIYGRTDDQIMLSTGEKTNPGPLESILAQDPHIKSGVIFGRGRFHNGLIVDPVEAHAFDPHDTDRLSRFRERIWPTIVKMNAFAPQHSRIFKEMITVSSPQKPFTYTAKGTTRRQAIIADYAAEIDALYVSAKEKAFTEIPPPLTWDHEAIIIYVRQLVHSVLNRHIQDDDDMFQYGCDSLQAAWIRNGILSAARTAGINLDTLPANFVFQQISIQGISVLVSSTAQTTSSALLISHDERVKELLALVDRFTSDFPTRPSTSVAQAAAQYEVVLLTGSTGGLGCHLLAELVSDPSIGKVYALNRGVETQERQLANMRRQGLDSDCVSSPKVVFLEGDLDRPSLGLSSAVYNEVRDSVTLIIHNAWKVDFNQSIKSFEKQLIGLRNLVDLAISSPNQATPRLLFTSSVGVFRNPAACGYSGHIPEEPIANPAVAVGMGYAESKWVGERILEEARRTAGLRSTVVRVGQLCGAQNGYWNEHEWFPAVVQSAEYLKCLPDVNDEDLISWIPSAMAAEAMLQMRLSEEPVLHLVHPRPVTWKSIMCPISQRLQAPLVPYKVWLAALEACLSVEHRLEKTNLQQYPALRLLEFFRSVKTGPDMEPLGMVRLDTQKAILAAPSLQTGGQLTAPWASAWLNARTVSSLLPQNTAISA